VGRVEEPALERDGAIRAEAATWCAGLGVERDDACVDRREEDSAATWRIRRCAWVEPRRDASIGEVAPLSAAIDLGVVRPLLFPGRGIERDHSAERRREVHRAVDDEWRRLELDWLSRRLACLAGAVGPRDGETRDVGAIDLRERREPCAELIVSVR